jgi:predicted nucleic acid-binding protein
MSLPAVKKWILPSRLELIGTLGLLLAARLDGRIASLQREIENLEGAGFRVAPKLVERLLMEAGEGTA